MAYTHHAIWSPVLFVEFLSHVFYVNNIDMNNINDGCSSSDVDSWELLSWPYFSYALTNLFRACEIFSPSNFVEWQAWFISFLNSSVARTLWHHRFYFACTFSAEGEFMLGILKVLVLICFVRVFCTCLVNSCSFWHLFFNFRHFSACWTFSGVIPQNLTVATVSMRFAEFSSEAANNKWWWLVLTSFEYS